MKRLLLLIPALSLFLTGCNFCFWCDVDIRGPSPFAVIMQSALAVACLIALIIGFAVAALFIASNRARRQAEERDLIEYRKYYE